MTFGKPEFDYYLADEVDEKANIYIKFYPPSLIKLR